MNVCMYVKFYIEITEKGVKIPHHHHRHCHRQPFQGHFEPEIVKWLAQWTLPALPRQRPHLLPPASVYLLLRYML